MLYKGVPMITTTQQNQASAYLIMTTIASFFSGVMATYNLTTRIQSSYCSHRQHSQCAVVLITHSQHLVCSEQPADHVVEAFFHVRGPFYRFKMSTDQRQRQSPNERLGIFMSTWLSKGPMVSLILSGSLYSSCLSFPQSRQQQIVFVGLLRSS